MIITRGDELKISKKMMASVLCSSLFVAGPASFINPSSSFAAENDTGYTIVNSSSTANTHNFSLVNLNNKVDVDMVETDESITIKTITNGEENTIIYNKSYGSATLNGEKMNLKVSEPEFVIDESLSLFASDTPVYVSSGNVSFAESVDGLGKIVVVITAAILLAKATGIAIPKKVVETKVADALSWAGIGTTIAMNTFKGSLTYKLYRTTDKFNTGYPGSINQYQYKYRYQDFSVDATLVGKSLNIYFDEVGSWWFQDKPMR